LNIVSSNQHQSLHIVTVLGEIASYIHEDNDELVQLWGEQYILLPVGLVEASLILGFLVVLEADCLQ